MKNSRGFSESKVAIMAICPKHVKLDDPITKAIYAFLLGMDESEFTSDLLRKAMNICQIEILNQLPHLISKSHSVFNKPEWPKDNSGTELYLSPATSLPLEYMEKLGFRKESLTA